MEELKVARLLEATGGELLRKDREAFTGVSIDSRTVKPGELFFAIKGERFDGHQYSLEVAKRGAAGVVISDKRFAPGSGFAVLVPDTRKALNELAGLYRGLFDVRVAAVTGSNGKTTTRNMLATILARRYRVLEPEANFNNDIGVPLTAFRIDPSTEAAVFEIEMNEFGGTKALARVCVPEVGVVTNIGDTHLETMKTREGVAREKAELVEELPEQGTAVLNADDRLAAAIGEKFGNCSKLLFGIRAKADVHATGIKDLGLQGIEFLLNGEHRVSLAAPGRHSVYNCLAACAAASALGMRFDDMPRALEGYQGPPMRLKVLHLAEGITLLDDSYNANPQSVHAALDVLCGHECAGQRLVILGDMLELGDVSLQAHTEMGNHVASCVDRAVFVGPMGEHAVSVVLKSGVGAGKLRSYRSSKDVLVDLVDIVRPADTILVKGSRAMRMELITDAITTQYAQ
ncbi:MAG: UDP-N-acetylmuramoyl-tripeptide--D-alanyl-D-alanine ligase [candidate division WOR-3 bacterium]|nr:MAG: UDP-N-acetylmuramoyl-tripeptide--D-alanyl-D-alanine ligase [candidate division WOR-3 bacterium]